MKHKVSVIMPVLNGEQYLCQSLDSLAAQTYTNLEVVLVNDGSTDRTCEIAESYENRLNIRLLHHASCQGIAASVNDGIGNATGEFIAFLDHDDLLLPHMLQTQVQYLEQHPDAGMVHSDFQTIDAEGTVVEASVARCRDRKRPSGKVFRELFLDSFIVANTVLIRKECFDRLGGFDEKMIWGDYHMWLRIARHYEVHYVPDVLAQYRQHSSQSTRSLTPLGENEEPIVVRVLRNILELYPDARRELGEKTVQQRFSALYFGGAYYAFELRDFACARSYLRRAIQAWPSGARNYAMYAATLLKPSHATALREAWRRLVSPGKQASRQWHGGQS